MNKICDIFKKKQKTMAKKRRFKRGVTITEVLIITDKNGEPVWVLDEKGLRQFDKEKDVEYSAADDGGEPTGGGG